MCRKKRISCVYQIGSFSDSIRSPSHFRKKVECYPSDREGNEKMEITRRLFSVSVAVWLFANYHGEPRERIENRFQKTDFFLEKRMIAQPSCLCGLASLRELRERANRRLPANCLCPPTIKGEEPAVLPPSPINGKGKKNLPICLLAAQRSDLCLLFYPRLLSSKTIIIRPSRMRSSSSLSREPIFSTSNRRPNMEGCFLRRTTTCSAWSSTT